MAEGDRCPNPTCLGRVIRCECRQRWHPPMATDSILASHLICIDSGEDVGGCDNTTVTRDGWMLRAWRDDDTHAYETIVTDPTVGTFCGEFDGGPPVADKFLHLWGEGRGMYLRAAVCSVVAPGLPVGLVEAGGGDGTHPVELTIGLRQDVQGHGAGKAVVRMVNQLVAKALPGVRVTGSIRRENTACLAMVASLGIEPTDDPDNEEYLRA